MTDLAGRGDDVVQAHVPLRDTILLLLNVRYSASCRPFQAVDAPQVSYTILSISIRALGHSITWFRRLVDIDTQLPQVNLGLANLSHEFLVRVGHIVESEDTETEAEEEVCAKGDEDPEGELCVFVHG